MSLSEILLEKKNQTIKNAPKEKVAIMLKATEKLKKDFLSKNALKTGAQFPNFNLPNTNQIRTNLIDFKTDFLVISFYRGGWCPYCNLELNALQAILPELKALNTNLIAITPETPDNSLTTKEKNKINFPVLSDLNNEYAKSLGLVFKMPNDLIEVYKQFNLNIEQHNGNDNYELPMPATYVLDKNRKVIYSFVSEDYTERAEPSFILDLIKKHI